MASLSEQFRAQLTSQQDARERHFTEIEVKRGEQPVMLAIGLLGSALDAHYENSKAPFTQEYLQLRELIYNEIAAWVLAPENQVDSAEMIANPNGIERQMTIDLSQHIELAAVVPLVRDSFIRDSRGGFTVSQRVDREVPQEIIDLNPGRYVHEWDRISTTLYHKGTFRIVGVAAHPDAAVGEASFVVRFVQLPNELEAQMARYEARKTPASAQD